MNKTINKTKLTKKLKSDEPNQSIQQIQLTKLTKQGYIINKSDLTSDQIQMIENDLTIEPEIDSRFKNLGKISKVSKSINKTKKVETDLEEEPEQDDDGIFNIYMESSNGEKFVIPRYYGLAKFGPPAITKFTISDFDKVNINFIGQLRDYQIDVMNTVLPEYCDDINNPHQTLKPYGGSIIAIPPGKGKTVCAIYLACKLGLKTLIIVNKTFLMNQWKERIMQYTGEEAGMIQQNKINISGKKFVVGMLHSVSLKDYDKELFQAFPLIIYDECHHLGARMFSKSLIKVQGNYFLGLSATPERKDHMDKVFKYFLGDIKYRGKFDTNNNVTAKVYLYNIQHLNFKPMYNRFLKTFMGPSMVTKICKIDERNNFIIKLITDILTKDKGRKILVLSGRCNASGNEKSVNHLKILADKLDQIEQFKDKWGYYKGGMKQTQLDISSEKQIILGTYEMAQEALDIADLDTLILASPFKGDLTQTIGRILRAQNEYDPLIIDIVDNILPFSNQARNRLGYYAKENYKCEHYLIEDGYDISDEGIKKLNQSLISPIMPKDKKHNDDNKDDVWDD